MFNRLIGNESVKAALQRFISNARVPNAMLFAGDDGVGKRQFALEIAKAFICSEPVDGDADAVVGLRRAGQLRQSDDRRDDADAQRQQAERDHVDLGADHAGLR